MPLPDFLGWAAAVPNYEDFRIRGHLPDRRIIGTAKCFTPGHRQTAAW